MNTKIVAMYLPQYHETLENNQFWGEGFTDWVSVRGAKPLYKGHVQPQRPLNEIYYDLSLKENVKWQAELAKEYGIHGFGIYHYWFSDEKVLLTKPAEIILNNKDIDIKFFFAWDNISWRRTWSKVKANAWSPLLDEKQETQRNNEPPMLVEYKLGSEKEWKNHFFYLLPYFKDDRYIKKDGQPLFFVYHYDEKIVEMGNYWSELAQKEGFKGVKIVFRYDPVHVPEKCTAFCYEPAYSGWSELGRRLVVKILNLEDKMRLKKYSYDKVWARLLRNADKMKAANRWVGAFVGYDDSPRRGERGRVIVGATPEKFQRYMKELLAICKEHKKDYVILTAWNEWGEGAYLEPDEQNQYAYLNALKKAVSESEKE